MERFIEQVAVVTGAATGIGYGVSKVKQQSRVNWQQRAVMSDSLLETYLLQTLLRKWYWRLSEFGGVSIFWLTMPG